MWSITLTWIWCFKNVSSKKRRWFGIISESWLSIRHKGYDFTILLEGIMNINVMPSVFLLLSLPWTGEKFFFRIKCILLYGHIGPAIGPKPPTINFTIMVDGFIETMHLRENRELQCKIICQWMFLLSLTHLIKMSTTTYIIFMTTILPCKRDILIGIIPLLKHYVFF